MKKWLRFTHSASFQRFKHLPSFLGLLFVLFFGAFNILAYRQNVLAAANPEQVGKDMVSRWDRMMRKLTPDLPDHGVIGYLADWDIPGNSYGTSDQTVEYLLTQYSLAPLTLARGSKYAVIVGNFSDSGDARKIENVLNLFHLRILKQQTNEILLLEGLDQ